MHLATLHAAATRQGPATNQPDHERLHALIMLPALRVRFGCGSGGVQPDAALSHGRVVGGTGRGRERPWFELELAHAVDVVLEPPSRLAVATGARQQADEPQV